MAETRIMIDFESQDAAVVFFEMLKADGYFSEGDVGLYKPDGLDTRKAGITPAHTLIVKSSKDRLKASRVA